MSNNNNSKKFSDMNKKASGLFETPEEYGLGKFLFDVMDVMGKEVFDDPHFFASYVLAEKIPLSVRPSNLLGVASFAVPVEEINFMERIMFALQVSPKLQHLVFEGAYKNRDPHVAEGMSALGYDPDGVSVFFFEVYDRQGVFTNKTVA